MIQHPTLPHPTNKLAIIGEYPRKEELAHRKPFVGSGGRLLTIELQARGLATEQCLLTYASQTSSLSSWDNATNATYRDWLMSEIDTYSPNCVLLLGQHALRAARPDLCYRTRPTKASPSGWRIPVDNFRGSIIPGFDGRHKCVVCYSPEDVQRVYTNIGLFKFDIARAVSESKSLDYPYKSRDDSYIKPTFVETIEWLTRIRDQKPKISVDIEGYPDDIGITMFGIAISPYQGIVIPFWIDGDNYWQHDEEVQIWSLLATIMADGDIAKTAQNLFYEQFVCMWRHRMVIANFTEDSMMKHYELFPELPKGLGTVVSIWTKESYYKDERTTSDTRTKLGYNFKDITYTYEAEEAMDPMMDAYPKSSDHYRFNMKLAPPISFMNIRGCRLDQDRLKAHKDAAESELDDYQLKIDSVLLDAAHAADVLTRKRKSDPWAFNVKSTKQKQWLLYNHLGFKPSARWGPKTDDSTMLRYYEKSRDPILRTVIQAVRKRTRLSDIEKLRCDPDGRIRTSLNLCDTGTSRLASRESMAMVPLLGKDGNVLKWVNTGTNLQNVTKELRDCFVPDTEDYDFWQLDLEGADGWTVAADLAALGYPAMLEDYLAGIKPAKVLMLMLAEYEAKRDPMVINKLPIQELKKLTSALVIPEGRDSQGRSASWKYDACKATQHATNYDGKAETISAILFKRSDGLVDLTKAEAGIYQYLYKLRYNPQYRTEWIADVLKETGCIQTAIGFRRKFFGMRSRAYVDPQILRTAASLEPQANTTGVTNMALVNMWYDPTNRSSTGWLHVEPFLAIHDALAGQWHKSNREWGCKKLHHWFQNNLRIHGIDVSIPADGGWGDSWKTTINPLLT